MPTRRPRWIDNRRPFVPRLFAPGYCWLPVAIPDEAIGIRQRADIDEYVTAIEIEARERRIRAEVRDQFREASRLHR